MDTPKPVANIPNALPSPADLPSPSSFDDGTSLSQAEASEAAAFTKEQLAAGKITQAQADQAFDQLGVPVEQRGLQPDQRSVDQVQLDESFPPAKGEQYAMRCGIPGQEAPMTPELKQFDTKARGWMVDSGLPVSLGNSLLKLLERWYRRRTR